MCIIIPRAPSGVPYALVQNKTMLHIICIKGNNIQDARSPPLSSRAPIYVHISKARIHHHCVMPKVYIVRDYRYIVRCYFDISNKGYISLIGSKLWECARSNLSIAPQDVGQITG